MIQELMPMAEQDLSILLLINLLQHYITHIHQLILNIHTLNQSNFKQKHFEISALHLFYGVGTKKRSNYSSIRDKLHTALILGTIVLYLLLVLQTK